MNQSLKADNESSEMFFISKRLEIAGAHHLSLEYESKCTKLHGHNWIVTVYCASRELDKNGMVVDFKHIKNIVSDKLDHAYLNEIFDFNPTAENIAKWICHNVPHCYKVTVEESQGNSATYLKNIKDRALW